MNFAFLLNLSLCGSVLVLGDGDCVCACVSVCVIVYRILLFCWCWKETHLYNIMNFAFLLNFAFSSYSIKNNMKYLS